MTTITHLLVFALGVGLSRFYSWKFGKPTTVNEYSGTVKNKVRGRNNTQTNDNRCEINGDMSRRDVIKIWKELKNN